MASFVAISRRVTSAFVVNHFGLFVLYCEAIAPYVPNLRSTFLMQHLSRTTESILHTLAYVACLK